MRKQVAQSPYINRYISRFEHVFERFLLWLFPKAHINSKIICVIYASTAAFILFMECSIATIGNSLPHTRDIVSLLVLALLLSFCWLRPPYIELITALIFMIEIAAGLFDHFGSPVLAIYIIVGNWIVRSWLVPGVVLCTLVEACLIWNSDVLATQAVSSLFGSGITIIISLTIRKLKQKEDRAHEQIELAHVEGEQAINDVREQLAAQLHDTLAKDLAQIVIIIQQLVAKGEASKKDLLSLEKLATTASQRLRPTILKLNNEAGRTNISQTIALVSKMLSTKNICLNTQLSPDIDSILSRQQALLSGLAIREGCTNILKYTPSNTTASLSVDVGKEGAVHISLSNKMNQNLISPGITGGFGLTNVEQQLAASDGILVYGQQGDRWIFYAEIPDGRKRASDERS